MAIADDGVVQGACNRKVLRRSAGCDCSGVDFRFLIQMPGFGDLIAVSC